MAIGGGDYTDPAAYPQDGAPATPTAPRYGSVLEFFRSLGPRATADLTQAVDQAVRLGLLPPGSRGVDGRVVLPSGETYETARNGDWTYEQVGVPSTTQPPSTTPPAPTPSPYTYPTTGNAYDGPDFSGFEIDPSYLEAFTGTPPSGGGIPQFNRPGDFSAPTFDELYASDDYNFRLNQGRGVLENSAAARGTLNSGGTLMDILDYGQKAGSQEYSNHWDRKFNVWNANWNNAMAEFGAHKDVNDTAYSRAWQRYADARDLHFKNRDHAFDKIFAVANMGANAAR